MLLSSDKMKIFYTEHDFQVEHGNLRVQLEIPCRENRTILNKCNLKKIEMYTGYMSGDYI